MNDLPRQKLRELIIEYGRSLCDDPRRCEALLKDYCGQHKREIFVLVNALKNRVAEDLINASAGVPPALLLGRLIQRLEDELGLAENAARWAVESWALALDIFDQPVPVVKPTAVPPIPQTLKPVTLQQSGFEKKENQLPKPTMPPSGSPQRGVKKIWILVAVGISIVSVFLLVQIKKPRYKDNGDGTVTDVQTRLQWMRCSLGQEWKNGMCRSEAQKYTWQKALDAASTLNRQGGYAGYRDWRVPTREELRTLVYCSSGQPKTWNNTGNPCEGDYGPPTIYQPAFPNTQPIWYWSASPYAPNADGAWFVLFVNGLVNADFKGSDFAVRLVRGGP